MATRDELLEAIAVRIVGFRSGEIYPPDAAHVDRWVSQFSADAQLPMLDEMNRILAKTYAPKPGVVGFLTRLVQNKKLTGEDSCAFWRGVKFLNIQKGGQSQHEMLALFDEALQAICGFKTADCGADPKT